MSIHLPVPDEIAKEFIDGNDRRVICTINNKVKFQCAIIPMKVYYLIQVNKENRKKLQLEEGEPIQVTLEKDHSEYGMEMCSEMEYILNEDIEGHAHFQQLSMGKKRSLIHLVSKVKNVDSRISKTLAILEHLKEYDGNLEYAALMETIKKYNQRNHRKL